MNMMNNQDESREFNQNQMRQKKSRGRGLAAADAETRIRVASAGGRAVSQNRKHMSDIGRIGGRHSHIKAEREATSSEWGY